MLIGIIADIHGNLPALQAVLNKFKRSGVERVINLGDTIGLGPDSAEVIDELMAFPIPTVSIFGNHDKAALGIELKQPHLIQKPERMRHALIRKQLSDRHVAWIQSLPATIRENYDGCRMLAMHYPTDEQSLYLPVNFQADASHLVPDLEKDPANVILFGHHHTTFYHGPRRDKLIYNPGSCGCPHAREGIARAGIIDTEPLRIIFLEERYDVEPVIQRLYDSEDPTRFTTLAIFFGEGNLEEAKRRIVY